MTQNLKLSLWDAFVFFLSGWAILVCLYTHLWASGIPVNVFSSSIPAAALGVSAFIAPLLVGLLFEPLANRAMALISWLVSSLKTVFKRQKSTSCRKLEPLIQAVKNDIPTELSNDIAEYHWAKDYLSQEGIETPYMPFLSKFGFYRNLGILSLLNVVLIPCLYEMGKSHVVVFMLMVAATVLYLWRSQSFYNHLGDSIFRHYTILQDRKKAESGK